MDRSARVAEFWNWIPHFRAIAESEHLPTAAARVHVTPPALSRTLKLLEEQVGHPLFHRRAGRLVLTADGRRLLEAARYAMRVLESAHDQLGAQALAGPLAVAAGGVSQPLVLRALLALRAQHPGLQPHLSTPDPDRVVEQLWSGALDVVVGSFVRQAAGIRTEVLGFEPSSVWCGPRHPLYGRAEVPLSELLTHPFTAPPEQAGDRTQEGWPTVVQRVVAIVVDRMAVGMEIVGATDLLAVLPDSLAAQSRVPLHRLEVVALSGALGATPDRELLPSTPIVAHVTEPLAPGRGADRLLTELRAVLAARP